MEFDFSGWATKNNLLCGDGRTILKDAFKDCDGEEVPLVWNHQHNSVDNVLGHALLENRSDGVYAYCKFNNDEAGKAAKERVRNGDIKSLSIYANKLKQLGGDVIHGVIREVSLVIAGANPGAQIDFVMAHSDDGEDEITGFKACYDENIMIYHSDKEDPEEKEEDNKEMEDKNKKSEEEIIESMTDEQKEIMHSLIEKAKNGEDSLAHVSNDKKAESNKKEEEPNEKEASKENSEKTVEDVIKTMNPDQKSVLYALVGQALEEGEKNMKHNVFDNDVEQADVLTHSDEESILNMAKAPSCGSFQTAFKAFAEENELSHGVIDGDALNTLFPDYKDVYPGEPETLNDDESWVQTVIQGTKKLPFSRIRTRQLDARDKRSILNAKGYTKGKFKKEIGDVDLLQRTTDPQTVYVKDSMHRDDIIDFTSFDIVGYQWKTMKSMLYKELALAILVGDGRGIADPDKIKEDHIRPIWTDDELFVIHRDVDFVTARSAIQGSDTGKHFGTGFVDSEAIIEASLFAREKYKGSGNLTFFCTPHLVTVMLLARDFNGRRIYSTANDLKAALNVSNIVTIEQFEGLQPREDSDGDKHKMLGMFVNLSDYAVGSTKGGEITQFDQFDIDFNQYKYLIETRCSGALTRVKSAIVLEEPVSSSNK